MSTFFFPQIKEMLDDEAKKIAYSCALYVLRDDFHVKRDEYKAELPTYSDVCKEKSHPAEQNDDVFQVCRAFSKLSKRHEIPSDSILV